MNEAGQTPLIITLAEAACQVQYSDMSYACQEQRSQLQSHLRGTLHKDCTNSALYFTFNNYTLCSLISLYTDFTVNIDFLCVICTIHLIVRNIQVIMIWKRENLAVTVVNHSLT